MPISYLFLQLSDLKKDFAGLKADFAGLKKDFAGMKTDFAGMKADFAGMKTDFAGMKADFAGMKTDLLPFVEHQEEAISVFELKLRDEVSRWEFMHYLSWLFKALKVLTVLNNA